MFLLPKWRILLIIYPKEIQESQSYLFYYQYHQYSTGYFLSLLIIYNLQYFYSFSLSGGWQSSRRTIQDRQVSDHVNSVQCSVNFVIFNFIPHVRFWLYEKQKYSFVKEISWMSWVSLRVERMIIYSFEVADNSIFEVWCLIIDFHHRGRSPSQVECNDIK